MDQTQSKEEFQLITLQPIFATVLRLGVDMKIFDALSNAGDAGLSAEQLAAHIDADPQLVCKYLVRLDISLSKKLTFPAKCVF